MKKNRPVCGRTIRLSGGRRVFFGYRENDPNSYFCFRNAEGYDNAFRLSPEATDALRVLLTDSTAGQPVRKMTYRVPKPPSAPEFIWALAATTASAAKPEKPE